MLIQVKLRKVGNSVGMVLPKKAMARLNVGEGDVLYLTEAPEGGFRLTARNPEFARQMRVADSLLGRYRHALQELAK